MKAVYHELPISALQFLIARNLERKVRKGLFKIQISHSSNFTRNTQFNCEKYNLKKYVSDVKCF